MSILSEDIKNTRFILTLMALCAFGFAGFGTVGLILFSAMQNTTVDSTLLTVFTTFMGLLGGLVTVAYNSYFKDRQSSQESSTLGNALISSSIEPEK